jgi:hypothetical protein
MEPKAAELDLVELLKEDSRTTERKIKTELEVV